MKNYLRKRGMTLVEAMIAISIASVVMLGITVFFTRMWTSYEYTLELGAASLAASRGVEQVVETVRTARSADDGAYLIESGDDNSFIFYSNVDDDDDTERVRYFFDTGTGLFRIGVTNPNTSTVPPTYDPGTDEVVRTVTADVVNNLVSEPVFTYYDDSNTPLTTPVTASDVTLVKVVLYVNPEPEQAPDHLRIQSVVLIRNVAL